jgi:hypothetical protein
LSQVNRERDPRERYVNPTQVSKNARPGPPAYDIYFGPKPPAGKESNWIQTVPGRGWFTILRLYGPVEPWFDKTWRPGDIVLVK